MSKSVLQEKVSNFVINNDWLLINSTFQIILILFWLEYIFPLLTIEGFNEIEDPRIVLAIAGFVWFSIISFIFPISSWFTSWTMTVIEKTFYLGIKIHSKVIRK